MSLLRTTRLTKRSFTGSRVNGVWVKGEPEDMEFAGTVQPASGKVMEYLPEGKRNAETISVFAPPEMQFTPADDERNVAGDLVIYEGRPYEVVIAKKWNVGLLPHWELAASRVDG